MSDIAEVATGTPTATEAAPAAAPVAAPAESKPAPEQKLTLRETIKKQVREANRPENTDAKPASVAPEKSKESAAIAAPATEAQKRLAPKSWKIEHPDDEQLFFTLPEKARERWQKRDEDYEKGIGKYRADAEFGGKFKQVLEPWNPYFQQLNVTPDVAINALLKAEQTLRTGAPAQKIQALQNLIRDYGIDLSGFQQAQSGDVAPSQNTGYTDPNVAHLINEVQQLRGYVQHSQYDQKQRELSEAQSVLDRFAKNPANKHFEAVREDMATLFSAGLATSVEDAYQQAIYRNPEIREEVLREQIAAREAEARKQQQELKAKAVSLTGAPPATSAPSQKGLRDFIREQIRSSSQPARV